MFQAGSRSNGIRPGLWKGPVARVLRRPTEICTDTAVQEHNTILRPAEFYALVDASNCRECVTLKHNLSRSQTLSVIAPYEHGAQSSAQPNMGHT